LATISLMTFNPITGIFESLVEALRLIYPKEVRLKEDVRRSRDWLLASAEAMMVQFLLTIGNG